MYLGDYAAGETVHFKWSTNAADGSSITRATDGTVSVYKDDSSAQTTTGVTDSEDFDSLAGIHHCKIVTSDAFYATATDYTVVLSAATIDGKTVNAVLAHFSIENRHHPAAPSIPTAAQIASAVWDLSHSAHQLAGSTGESLAAAGLAGDPWSANLPGAYVAGKAGYILGAYLDQKISLINQSPGAGAVPFIYTVTDFISGNPIPGVTVWATNDAQGTQILASGSTDLLGQVTFYLDPGTIYVWRAKRGWDFINPDTETV